MKFTVEIESKFNSEDLILIRTRSFAPSGFPDKIIVGAIDEVYYDSENRKIMYKTQLAPRNIRWGSRFLSAGCSINIPETMPTYQFPDTLPAKLKDYIKDVIISGNSERTSEVLEECGVSNRMSRGDLALYINCERYDHMTNKFSVELRRFAGYATLDMYSPMLFDSHRNYGNEEFRVVSLNDVIPIPGFNIDV